MSARPKTDQDKGLSEHDRLKISLLRNALYHDDRERFFATVHRAIMFFVVVGGIATVATVTQDLHPWLIAGLGLLVTILATLDLALGIDASARQHASLRQRMYQLLSKAEDESYPTSKLREDLALVYADEPPTMNAVNALAYNTAMAASGRSREYFYDLGPWQRAFRHLRAFSPSEFKTFEEIEEEKRASARSA